MWGKSTDQAMMSRPPEKRWYAAHNASKASIQSGIFAPAAETALFKPDAAKSPTRWVFFARPPSSSSVAYRAVNGVAAFAALIGSGWGAHASETSSVVFRKQIFEFPDHWDFSAPVTFAALRSGAPSDHSTRDITADLAREVSAPTASVGPRRAFPRTGRAPGRRQWAKSLPPRWQSAGSLVPTNGALHEREPPDGRVTAIGRRPSS